MKKTWDGRAIITLSLIACSAAAYGLHYLVFKNVPQILSNLISDFAFLFIYALVIILVVERVLTQREKRAMLTKMNMVIGAYFSEMGLHLLRKFSAFSNNSGELGGRLQVNGQWNRRDFQKAADDAKSFPLDVRITVELLPSLGDLRSYLLDKQPFMLRLLENPNLLEHESFTDLLWAVFHLAEELAYRDGKLENLPQNDLLHLATDIKRAYTLMMKEWIVYMGHLKESYPFLFSLAARINPFNPLASAVVR